MSETSITDGETQFYGDVIIKLHGEWVPYCAYQTIERELNAANKRIKQLEEALSCVVPTCLGLHHSKKHRHKYNEPCPVEKLIFKAKEAKP